MPCGSRSKSWSRENKWKQACPEQGRRVESQKRCETPYSMGRQRLILSCPICGGIQSVFLISVERKLLCWPSCAVSCDRIAARSWRACAMDMLNSQHEMLKYWRLDLILEKSLLVFGRRTIFRILVCPIHKHRLRSSTNRRSTCSSWDACR